MTATTVDFTAANEGVAAKLIEAAVQNLLDNITTGDGGKGCGVPFFYGDTIPATVLTTAQLDEASDTVRMFKFPPGSYITDFRGTPSDMDSNATPTLVYSIVVIDDAAVVKDTLVASSTNGQAAAGSDRIANAAVGQFVGDRWLAFKVGTGAATAVAGTYGFFVGFTAGVLSVNSANDPDPATTDLAF